MKIKQHLLGSLKIIAYICCYKHVKFTDMKTFEQIINEIEKEEPKEKVKQILKKEYETCIKYAKEDSERLERSIKRVIKGERDYISIYAIYAQHKEIELSNYIAKLYEDLFGEKIAE